MGYLFIGILLYLAYRFIVGFVIPVVRATSQVRRQFEQMKQQTGQPSPGDIHPNSTHPHPQKPKFDVEGEYIPFEEVK